MFGMGGRDGAAGDGECGERDAADGLDDHGASLLAAGRPANGAPPSRSPGSFVNVGLTARQVVEAILHCIPYTGFPRVLNAIGGYSQPR
jgi:hypothetical protein